MVSKAPGGDVMASAWRRAPLLEGSAVASIRRWKLTAPTLRMEATSTRRIGSAGARLDHACSSTVTFQTKSLLFATTYLSIQSQQGGGGKLIEIFELLR